MGQYRVKPAPDPYAELKAAYETGRMIQIDLHACGRGWVDLPRPDWTSAVELYRVKPKPVPEIDLTHAYERHTYHEMVKYLLGYAPGARLPDTRQLANAVLHIAKRLDRMELKK